MTPVAPKIEDHGAIGDGRSIALVAKDGAIDWLCWPRFESPALFAALLDPARGGQWLVRPADPARVSWSYVPGTNVLVTRWEMPGGVVTVTDLMTISTEEAKRRALVPEHEILRVVRCERGVVEMVMRFEPRPDYGRTGVRLAADGALGVRCDLGTALVTLRAERALEVAGGTASARVALRAGDEVAFSLTYDAEAPAVLPPLGEPARDRVAASIAWWSSWIAAMSYDGPYRDAIERSLLVLKLLSYAPSGAIVAAGTTSLPERIGGALNWDYRFCWLRDAAFTMRALHGCGFRDDAAAWCDWLLHATRLTRPRLGVLYDVFGNPPEPERPLAHLAGYRGSRPVLVGNGADDQLQLDSYGEVIDAIVQVLPPGQRVDRSTEAMLASFGKFVCHNWHRPDHGIWEARGEPQHHTFSKVMCWVALDSLVQLAADGRARRLPLDDIRRQRDAIAAEVRARGFDARIGSYVDTYGSSELDASLLLLGWYGFEEPSSPRFRGTLAQIERRLRAAPGLYYRSEQMRGKEGAFWICSFWVAEMLARGGGTADQARSVLDTALAHGNDLGLFAEEIDPVTGAALGNFPQAYTHIGFVNAAIAVTEAQARPEGRREAVR